MAEKLTRRDLRHDWLMDHMLETWNWARGHIAVVGGTIGVLVLAAGVWAGVTHRAASSRAEMDTAFAHAEEEFARGSFQTAAVAFDNFLGRFATSRLGGEAMLRGASAHLFDGDTQGAQELFQRYLNTRKGKDPFLDRAARHGLASCLENTGDTKGAVAIYRELADASGNKVERAYHLKAAARCLAMSGDTDGAIKIYEDLARPDEQQGSPGDPEAASALLELRARAHESASPGTAFADTGT